MLADVGVEAGAQEEDGFLAVNPVEPLKRVVDGIVQARFPISRDSHPSQAIEQLGLVLCEVGKDFGPNVEGDECRPVVPPQAVDESGCRSDDVVKVIPKRIAEFR